MRSSPEGATVLKSNSQSLISSVAFAPLRRFAVAVSKVKRFVTAPFARLTLTFSKR